MQSKSQWVWCVKCGIWVAEPRGSGEAPTRAGPRIVTDRPISRGKARYYVHPIIIVVVDDRAVGGYLDLEGGCK